MEEKRVFLLAVVCPFTGEALAVDEHGRLSSKKPRTLIAAKTWEYWHVNDNFGTCDKDFYQGPPRSCDVEPGLGEDVVSDLIYCLFNQTPIDDAHIDSFCQLGVCLSRQVGEWNSHEYDPMEVQPDGNRGVEVQALFCDKPDVLIQWLKEQGEAG